MGNNNSMMESVFSALETGRTARTAYRTLEQTQADMSDYLERSYNLRPHHSTIAYLNPMHFKQTLCQLKMRVQRTTSSPVKPPPSHCT